MGGHMDTDTKTIKLPRGALRFAALVLGPVLALGVNYYHTTLTVARLEMRVEAVEKDRLALAGAIEKDLAQLRALMRQQHQDLKADIRALQQQRPK